MIESQVTDFESQQTQILRLIEKELITEVELLKLNMKIFGLVYFIFFISHLLH